jgi:ribonuclease D
LVVAANQNIYIFDMLRLGHLRIDLKRVLEENSPLKVVHNGGHILKRLQKEYNCSLNPVFDTQVAHLIISSSQVPISTEKCVNLYLQVGLPETDTILDEITSEDQLLDAAKRVAYLVKLFDHLVHEVLLKKLSTSSQKYVTSLSKVDSLPDAGFQISSGDNSALEVIEDFEKLYIL